MHVLIAQKSMKAYNNNDKACLLEIIQVCKAIILRFNSIQLLNDYTTTRALVSVRSQT